MTRPTMNGKVPASTPAADHPIPLSRLETTTAAPNAPVRSAVAASRLRPEIIISTLVGDQPTFIGGNLAGAVDVLLDELAECVAGQEGIDLRRPLDIFLPFRGALNFLHQVDIVRGLLRGDLARQPDRARLLELRNVETGFDAGRDIVPVLRLRNLRSVRKTLRGEGAKRALGAALPMPNAFAGVVDVRVDMAAGQLRGHGLEVIRDVLVGRVLLDPKQELVLDHGGDRRQVGVVIRDL